MIIFLGNIPLILQISSIEAARFVHAGTDPGLDGSGRFVRSVEGALLMRLVWWCQDLFRNRNEAYLANTRSPIPNKRSLIEFYYSICLKYLHFSAFIFLLIYTYVDHCIIYHLMGFSFKSLLFSSSSSSSVRNWRAEPHLWCLSTAVWIEFQIKRYLDYWNLVISWGRRIDWTAEPRIEWSELEDSLYWGTWLPTMLLIHANDQSWQGNRAEWSSKKCIFCINRAIFFIKAWVWLVDCSLLSTIRYSIDWMSYLCFYFGC